ncbi:MAG TPA: NHL repeat-containing protein [Solirubrobacteraceae bacterium]|nr:NHL repeat-containing protein [Solirubrobacteraceae bacterium]
MKIRALIAAALASAATVAVAPAAARADCPGAVPACPYSAASQIGARGEGVLRFPQAVAVGPDGSVHVADQASHVVQVFAPDGRFLRQVGIAGTGPGRLTSVGAIAVAPDGTLFVADGTNRIDRFGVNGELLGSFGRGGGTAPGQLRFGAGGGNDAGAGGGLAVAGPYLYVADTGNHRIQRFTLAGEHPAVIVPPGVLDTPQGLTVRGSRLTVADDRNHRLVVFDTGGRMLRTVGAGRGARPGQLSHPYDVAADAGGRLFVADDLNHRIVRFSAPPGYPYKGRWGAYGTGGGRLAYPRGIAVGPQGEIYVANTGNDRIDVFDRGGALLRSFGRSGRAPGQFDGPMGVAADASGFRAVTDSINGRVQLLAPDGTIAAVWGSPAPGPTLLPRPVAVAFDPAGNAYVLDQRRSRIAVFERTSGRLVRTIGAPGRGPGRLQAPSALAIDGAGVISVADTGNRRVARFGVGGNYLGAVDDAGAVRGVAVTPDGSRIYTTDSASLIRAWSPGGDLLDEFGGRGSKLGKLDAPAQITLDAGGNIWVADRGNNRVQAFGPAGERLLTMGRRGIAPGEFVHPTGVSVDCRGTLTVTDSSNNRVQQFTLAGAAVAPCAPLPPLGNPPPPKLPTLPEPVGPQVTWRALRTAGVLTARNLPLRVGCDTACALEVTATLTPRARPPRGRRAVTVALAAVRRAIPAGESGVVRLVLSDRNAARLRRALRGRRGLVARVQLTATAAAGDPTAVERTLTVTG